MNNIIKIDRPFVRELHKRLANLRKHHLGRLSTSMDTPTVKQLDEILSTMIWASTQHEEGRLSRFAIAFAEPTLMDHLALSFELPKRLGTEELRKLAPAVLPRSGRIMVWPNSATKVLEIGGLQTTGLTSTTFRVLDPARVTISFPMNSVIVEITGTRAGFISSDWNIKGQWMMAPKRAWPSETRALFSFLTVEVTEQILSRIRLLGHGGTVVFVPDNLRWSKSVDTPIFYGSKQKLNEVEPIVESLRKEISGIASKTASEIMKSGIELIASARYQRAISDAARSVAYLSAVDGATILNNKFSVLAFGVKLKPTKKKKASSTAEMVTIISPYEGTPTSDVPIDQEFRGTRHLSAARFVLNNPQAVAFVVSQDGGITGLIMDKDSPDKMLAIKSLELLL
ncbi:MAG TPA: hypothetical protein VJS64_07130 [Pyrinomonadaceae bacterium]|nr:hypothetical protein [Pyrinomonadaceae bacterium]